MGITDVVRGARRTLAGLQPHRVGQEEDERRLVQLHIDLVVNDDGVRGNAGEATDLRGPTQDAYDAYLDAVRRRRAWFTLAGTASFLIASVAGYLVLGEVRDADASVFRDPAATEQYLLTSGLVGIGVVLLGTAGVLLVLGSTKATWFVVAGVSWTLFAAVSPFVWLSVDPAFALAAVASIVVFAGVGALLMSVSAVVVQSLFRMGLRHAVITSLGDCLALALYGSVLRAHMPYDGSVRGLVSTQSRGSPHRSARTCAPRWPPSWNERRTPWSGSRAGRLRGMRRSSPKQCATTPFGSRVLSPALPAPR